MLTRTWKFTVTAFVLVGALAPGAAPAAAAGRAATLKRELGPGVRVSEHRGTGLVRFVGAAAGRPIARPSGLPASVAPGIAARAFLDRHGDAFGIRARDLRVSATARGTAGRSTVRFQQLRDDVPVLGGELVVNLDRDRNVQSASGEALAGDVATSPSIGAGAARDAAVGAVARGEGVSAFQLEAELPELAIYDAGLLGGPGPKRPSLVWRLEVTSRSATPIDQLVLVDAHRGTVALTIDQIEHLKNRSICDAANDHAQVPCTSPVATEADPPGAGDNADVSPAFEYSGDTYDFFAGLGRDSLDDEGLPLKSTVRYCDPAQACPYGNAFWNGEQMVYGQGYAAADDVVGHELTHGVTDFSAHLFYYYQSGAINESLSDVFGEFIDQTNGAGTDTAAVKWQMGEDIPGVGALRDMEDPTVFGDPDRMTSPNYTADSGEGDAGGVHTNSGVNNKAAFLIADGGTFNGRTVTGLGIAKASRIYYEVQTSMLTSASDYADLGSALPQACTNLVGTAGITSANCTEVGDAVAAVEMEAQPVTAAARAPEAPVCASGFVPTSLFSDDLENTASGNWSAGDDWYYPQNPNPYVGWDPTYATSGTENLWGDDPYAVAGTSSISMTRSVAIPAGSTAYLRFNHAFGFGDFQSTAYDGGVLEISTNNGASYSDIGPLLTDVGYTGTITDDYDNPLGGRPAFVQESNGYRSSRATLSSLAGQSVRFRFTTGWLSGGGGRGWFVDDVSVYTCSPPPPPDADGDGVPDASDACPAVAAATANGCPPAPPGGGGGGGGATPGGSGGTLGSTTLKPAVTLKSAGLRSCKVKGKGRRLRLRCTFTGFGAVKKVSLKVTRKGRTVARGSGKPTAKGVLSITPRKKLRRGSYEVTIKLTGAGGSTRTLKAKLKVR
jgi:bacillolysin